MHDQLGKGQLRPPRAVEYMHNSLADVPDQGLGKNLLNRRADHLAAGIHCKTACRQTFNFRFDCAVGSHEIHLPNISFMV